jgi:NitT/TauT family transport system substrate-binding protein
LPDIAGADRLFKTAVPRRSLLRGAAAGLVAGMLGGRSRTASAQVLKPFRVLIATSPPDPASHFFYYAIEKGFYAAHGLALETRALTTETLAISALLAGQADIAAFVAATAPLKAVGAGAKLKCVSAFAPKLDYQIVGNKSIADLKALDGHSFGISQPGTVSQFVPSLMLKQAGGHPQSLRWVPIGNSAARLQGVIGKTVDASAVNSPLAARIGGYDYLHVVADAYETLPDFLYTWEIATEETVRTKAAEIQAFLAATSDGVRWAAQHPDEAVVISRKLLPDLDGAEVERAIRSYIARQFWSASPVVPRRTWDFTTKAIIAEGLIDSAPTYDAFVVT